ncbi:hypothetical protein CC53_gp138 [Rhizobium phage vB_RleS_L338C]|uniref:hypothetical protein n=1 Tax=Rhizobium phage vB_RleS_L338C TaxID=1414737 RepID=UPI0003D870A4|nr:hypothetical protein CC53_gp138 [Rhizobium phage vB_RleS_L338C]AHC30555.1 hypothetical protein L338C_138 [Rhizobium phage vB_RleS_L338C]QNH72137.1 hypothetical protein P11VFA_011 [Rhizobium phage P11VFA]
MSRHTWQELVAPHVRRFTVAAKFGGSASWNAEGSAAMAELLSTMAKIIDEEVLARSHEGVAQAEARALGNKAAQKLVEALERDMRRMHGIIPPEYKLVAKLYKAHRRGK